MSGQRKIRIKDIAAMAKVSEGTVDRVLHNRGEVSEDTRKHVLEIVKKMEYTPNLLAKSLASKRTIQIAVLIPFSDSNSRYWEKPLEGIHRAEKEINTFNAHLNIHFFDLNDENSFSAAYHKILENEIDGIIFNPLFQMVSLDLIKILEKRVIPYIFIDTNLANSTNLSYYGQNAEQSGHAAARLMHMSLLDNSRILVLKLASSKSVNLHLINREKGFLSFFQKNINYKNIEVLFSDIDITQAGEPKKSLEQIIKTYPDIAGIFVTNSKVSAVAKYVSNKMQRHVLLVGYDLTSENISFLEKGAIDFLIGQKPEEQGFNSIMAMFNYLYVNKIPSKSNHSPIDIVMADNLDYYKK